MPEKVNATEMFQAYRVWNNMEHAMDDELLRVAGINPDKPNEWPLAAITYDDYDTSFEFKQVKGDWQPTRKMLKAWWELGFSRCWICYDNGDERYYEGSMVLGWPVKRQPKAGG